MVALHNNPLTARDIWPDNIWDEADLLRVQRAIDASIREDGLEGLAANLERSNRLQSYIRDHSPGLAAQQRVMARIRAYIPKAVPPVFSEEELLAIMDRFSMSNDGLGAGIHNKIFALLGNRT